MFVQRGRKIYLRTAPGGPGPIGAPDGGGAGAPEPVPTPAPTPAAPAAFDPDSPAAKAWADAERKRIAAEEGGKARDTARAAAAEAARADVLKTLAAALGVKPAEVDPAKLAADLANAQSEVRAAKVDQQVGRIARSMGADEDLVGALLERKHRAALAQLDPTTADFASKIEAMVKAEVDANPRLKLVADPPPTPPGGQAPVANGFAQPPNNGVRPGLFEAVRTAMSGK